MKRQNVFYEETNENKIAISLLKWYFLFAEITIIFNLYYCIKSGNDMTICACLFLTAFVIFLALTLAFVYSYYYPPILNEYSSISQKQYRLLHMIFAFLYLSFLLVIFIY